MKKLLLILLCLPMIGFGQLTMVPDAIFELRLINLGYDTLPVNGSVPTANIETITFLATDGLNIYDLTGIEDFIDLTHLQCTDNPLTTLDVSNNTALGWLRCENNQLTTLDVSNNLSYLDCNNNQLTTFDVSNNLYYLDCNNNQLATLDVSGAAALTELVCSSNYIECLDISNNTALENLECNDNLLEQLNTKNGNWQDMTVIANDNNLTCVEVDNIGVATNDWDFDSFATFSTNCNYTSLCATVSAIQEHTTNKELLKVTDLLGRETKQTNQPLFYIYDDGTVEKRIVIE